MSGKRARVHRMAHDHTHVYDTIRRVAVVCRERHAWTAERAHATVAREVPKRVRRDDIRRELRREYRSNRRGRRRRGVVGAVGAAAGKVMFRRVTKPLRVVESTVWLLVLVMLCIWAFWHYLTPQVVKDFGGWIVPGSCVAAEPPTIVRGAVWAAHDAGDALRTTSQLEVEPEQIRGVIKAGAINFGELLGAMEAGVHGKPSPVPPPPPVVPDREGLEPIAGCTPCDGEVIRQVAGNLASPGSSSKVTGQALTDAEVASTARAVGWPNKELVSGRLGARVLAESQNDPRAKDYVDGSHRGLLQLGKAEAKEYLPKGGDVFDPEDNLRAALGLWKDRGWQPWKASDDSYKQYLKRAKSAAVAQAKGKPAAAAPIDSCGVPTATNASVEGYANGQIPLDKLTPLSWAPGQRLRADAAAGLEALNRAYRAEFGVDFVLTDTYRSYREQVALYAVKPDLAAKPGTSNHGWGIAVDLGGGVQSFGTREHRWMQQAAPAFGWVHPDWAQQGGSRPEPWHWEWTGAITAG